MFFTLNYVHPNTGEDAPPLIEVNENFSVMGVFDGLGGAGGTKHSLKNGEIRTSAYLASRKVREIVSSFISKNYNNIFSAPEESSEYLVQELYAQLSIYADENNLRTAFGRTIGTMIKLLPTTMAVIICRENIDAVDVVCMWAGDSRCYVLSPMDGLSQLTVDDLIVPNDAMENLITDAPMSNTISLPIRTTRDAIPTFTINCHSYSIKKPCVLFSATDGCFGYLKSPMHFEQAILETFEEGVRENCLGENLGLILENKINLGHDDATMAARAFMDTDTISYLYETYKSRHAKINTLISEVSNDDFNTMTMDNRPMFESNMINSKMCIESQNTVTTPKTVECDGESSLISARSDSLMQFTAHLDPEVASFYDDRSADNEFEKPTPESRIQKKMLEAEFLERLTQQWISVYKQSYEQYLERMEE